MNAVLTSRITEDFAAAASELPQGLCGAEQRRSAIEALTSRGLPSQRDENWKYVNLRLLEKLKFAPVTAQASMPVTAAELPPALPPYTRYTFVDGKFAPSLSAPLHHAGVRVHSMLRDAYAPAASQDANARAVPRDTNAFGPRSEATSQSSLPPDLRFALLNDAFATDGAVIEVAADTDCPACIELVFVATADGKSAASYPRVDLNVGAGAHVGIVERHVSVGSDASFVNGVVNVRIARNARVHHYRIQQMGPRAIWFDTLTAAIAERASYQLYGVSLGGLSARSTLQLKLLGAHAEVAVSHVSVGGRTQVHDTYVLVEHIAPHARTEQNFRGISGGRARVACNGKIVVQKGAQGTDSRQSLRGLLAGSDAEVDVRPQLEIYTDDVRCSHGATAGKLDEDMLFYLLSRGLDRETALRLLKWAFLEDVVARIEIPELRRQIEGALAKELNETAPLREML